MKKLMIMASALAMAFAVNAATYTWGFMNEGDYEDINGNAFDVGGTAFLFLGTVSASDTAFDLSKATYIINQGYDEDTFYYGDVSLDTAKTSDKITSTAAGQEFSLLLFDTEVSLADLDKFEGNYVLYNGTSKENADPESGNKYAAFLRNGEIGASDWSTMAAPEPTSGLLLLLGVAGLALRRRRA